jgi:ABC-type Fe3+/spermidine/putrescine transport system ATPase subunit
MTVALDRPVLSAAATASARATLLRLDGLAKAFGGQVAVHPVSLDIAEGEFVTLLGPSGCGKTTLLRMIAGLESPTAGRIHAAGRDVTRLPPERRPFNMVFQNYALFPHLSVFDNVAYGPRCAGLSEAVVAERVRAALAMVQLAQHGARPVDQLSGGMSQRVALVRAIVCEPQVLLLDEPLAALDLQLRKRMQVELRAIQERIGTTFIHVTHDQEEALALSDRIVLMRAGQIEQVGTPAEVYERPKTRFVAEFVGESSLLPCTVRRDAGAEVEVLLQGGAIRRLPHYGAAGVAEGTPGLVSLRPHHLAWAAPERALLVGTVQTAMFAGHSVLQSVLLDAGAGTVRVATPPAEARPRGQRVGLDLLPGAGVFVRSEDSAVAPADAEP